MAARKNLGRGDGIESFRRYWAMLSKVPREPFAIDTTSLGDALEREGITVSRRTIQRDMERLALRFPGLRCDERTRPYQWKWDKDAPSFLVPKMNLEAAVTLELVEQHLKHILPRSSLKALRSVFAQARETLQSHETARLARWPRKVRSLPRGYPRVAPEVKTLVLDAVYRALLDERVLVIDYQKYGATSSREHLVHPLGLVERSGILTLVCTLNDYKKVVHLVLHRIRKATVQEGRRRKPRNFDLDEHIRSGALGFLVGSRIQLRARVVDDIAPSLLEAPLGPDQELTPAEDGWQRVSVTVSDSMELRGWLRSLGMLIEVESPRVLRRAFATEAQELVALYEAPG